MRSRRPSGAPGRPGRRTPGPRATLWWPGGAAEGCRAQIGKVSAALADSPGETEVSAGIEAIALASAALGEAQRHARACREECAAAEKRRASLGAEERQAWADLRRARDSVVGLGAPAVDGSRPGGGLAGAGRMGRSAAGRAKRARSRNSPGRRAALQAEVAGAEAALAGLLAEHGSCCGRRPGGAPRLPSPPSASARSSHLAAVRRDLAKAARLEQQALRPREEQRSPPSSAGCCGPPRSSAGCAARRSTRWSPRHRRR